MTFPDFDHAARAGSFDGTAAAYEYGRPGYPDAALQWWVAQGAALRPGSRILDLAAGTGKLTRKLLEHGCDVVAVEPLAGMRAELSRVLPATLVYDGTAEAIPLPDDSVDAVFVGQAFHWFDHAAALAEISRVLRPEGGLGMIWNDDDTSVPWVLEYSDVKHRSGPSPVGEPDWAAIVRPHFPVFSEVSLRWSETTSRDRLLANALSRSYVSVLPEAERPAALAPLVAVLATVPEPIEFPMTTSVCWCSRPSS